MYKKIYNPKINKYVRTNSYFGNKIIKKYIKNLQKYKQIGFGNYNLKNIDIYQFTIISLINNIIKTPNNDDVKFFFIWLKSIITTGNDLIKIQDNYEKIAEHYYNFFYNKTSDTTYFYINNYIFYINFLTKFNDILESIYFDNLSKLYNEFILYINKNKYEISEIHNLLKYLDNFIYNINKISYEKLDILEKNYLYFNDETSRNSRVAYSRINKQTDLSEEKNKLNKNFTLKLYQNQYYTKKYKNDTEYIYYINYDYQYTNGTYTIKFYIKYIIYDNGYPWQPPAIFISSNNKEYIKFKYDNWLPNLSLFDSLNLIDTIIQNSIIKNEFLFTFLIHTIYIDKIKDIALQHKYMFYEGCENIQTQKNILLKWENKNLDNWINIYKNNPIFIILGHGSTIIEDVTTNLTKEKKSSVVNIPKNTQIISFNRSGMVNGAWQDLDNFENNIVWGSFHTACNPYLPNNYLFDDDGTTRKKIFNPRYSTNREIITNCQKMLRENDNLNDIHISLNDHNNAFNTLGTGIYIFNYSDDKFNEDFFKENKNLKINEPNQLVNKFISDNNYSCNYKYLHYYDKSMLLKLSNIITILGQGTYYLICCKNFKLNPDEIYLKENINKLIREISKQDICY